jgi:hypothetical protein
MHLKQVIFYARVPWLPRVTRVGSRQNLPAAANSKAMSVIGE